MPKGIYIRTKKRKLSEEHKQKISESEKGKIVSLETRQKISESCIGRKYPNRKKPPSFTKEHRQHISEAEIGEKHYNYKHGLSKTNEYKVQIASKRRAHKLNQTPILTENEKDKIIMLYKISRYFGEGWQVDHIIPLSKGGLHHPNNLQIVTKEYNFQKHNSLNFRAPTALEYFKI
jgi:5-methylcytosine-specific restriction endonuclease McrA